MTHPDGSSRSAMALRPEIHRCSKHGRLGGGPGVFL